MRRYRMKKLIVFYSLGGNTRAVARKMAQTLKADILEIKTVKTYPDDYDVLLGLGQREVATGYILNSNLTASISPNTMPSSSVRPCGGRRSLPRSSPSSSPTSGRTSKSILSPPTRGRSAIRPAISARPSAALPLPPFSTSNSAMARWPRPRMTSRNGFPSFNKRSSR